MAQRHTHTYPPYPPGAYPSPLDDPALVIHLANELDRILADELELRVESIIKQRLNDLQEGCNRSFEQ